MPSYFSLITDLIKDLLSRQTIRVERFALRSGYPLHYLEDIEARLTIKIAPAIKDFYQQLGETEIVWSLAADADTPVEIFGEVYLQDINKCLGLNNYDEFWMRRYDENAKRQYKEWIPAFKPFDFYNADKPSMAGFLLKDGFLSDEVAFYIQGIGFGLTGVSLSQYLETMIRARAYTGWQEALLLQKEEDFLKKVQATFQ